MTPLAGTPQAASSATYNVNNQLTQWKGASLAYDANGNLTGATTTNSFAYTGRELDPPASISFAPDTTIRPSKGSSAKIRLVFRVEMWTSTHTLATRQPTLLIQTVSQTLSSIS